MSGPTPIMVDTSIWSLALRRRRKDLSKHEKIVVMTLAELIANGKAVIIGPVRLEILSGINDEGFFNSTRDYLRAFDDEQLTLEDYEEAASVCNLCTASGIASTPTDLLICAAASRLKLPIFTNDADFVRYARIISLRLPSTSQIAKMLSQSH